MFIVSALSITPERARRVLFSAPYGQSDTELVEKLSRIPEAAPEQSYDAKGMHIAVVQETTSGLFFFALEILHNDKNKSCQTKDSLSDQHKVSILLVRF